MPVKILLADKSITIQKVVEMLFSGRDYEVVCVSDGETALNEAKRVVPDVVLVDVDLPRIDGYSFATRLKQTPQLAQAPVILMMSRDDVYDGAKGKQAGIIDNIAKPFESQELIGKVKKAIAAAPPRRAEAAPSAAYEPAAPAPPAAPAKPKKAAPPDIFDIISEAPTQADLVRAAAPVEEETVYEVEPVVEEVEGPLTRDVVKSLPVGAKAVEEMRVGLGLTGEKKEPQPEIVTMESLDKAMEAELPAAFTPKTPSPSPQRPIPSSVQASTLPEAELRKIAETTIAKMARDVFANLPPVQPPQMSDETLRAVIEEKVSNMTKEAIEKAPAAQPPALSPSEMWSVAEEAVEKIATEFLQKQPLTAGPQLSDETLRGMVENVAVKTVEEMLEKRPVQQPPSVPASELRKMAEETVSQMAREVFKDMPPPVPKISEETVRRGIEEAVMQIAREVAREVIEKVAWEVIPHLAEVMIKEEIERLKAET